MVGGETWEFPTMHLCRLHEDGEQGGGRVRSNPEGRAGIWRGRTPRGSQRMVKAAQLHLRILCHLGLSWLSSSGLSLQH